MNKSLLYLLLPILVIACGQKKGPNSTGQSHYQTTKQPQGGVDVGNMTMNFIDIPNTKIRIPYPSNWKLTKASDKIELESGNTVIEAASFSPNDRLGSDANSLKAYIAKTHPHHTINKEHKNGLVSFDAIDSQQPQSIERYLLTEDKELAKISIKSTDIAKPMDLSLLDSVFYQYQATAYTQEKDHQVTLSSYDAKDGSKLSAAYSFMGHCFSYVDENCNHVSILNYPFNGNHNVSVGNAGYHTGRIVSLEENVKYEDIKVVENEIVINEKEIAINEVFKHFELEKPIVEKTEFNPIEGRSYLIRTMNWPEEDQIAKVYIEQIGEDGSLTIRYQNLLYVDKLLLKQQVNKLNRFTLENETPYETGYVKIYNRNRYHNYFYAVFNFEYANSGNPYITHNKWHIQYENWDQDHNIKVNMVTKNESYLQILENVELDDINSDNLKDHDFEKVEREFAIEKGKVYLLRFVDDFETNADIVYGAFKVDEFDPENRWVSLQYRRLKVMKASKLSYYRTDLNTQTIYSIRKKNLQKAQPFSTNSLPQFHNRSFADEVEFVNEEHYQKNILRTKNKYGLFIPYNGFVKLNGVSDIGSFDQNPYQYASHPLVPEVNFSADEVYLVFSQNYFYKAVYILKTKQDIFKNWIFDVRVLSVRASWLFFH